MGSKDKGKQKEAEVKPEELEEKNQQEDEEDISSFSDLPLHPSLLNSLQNLNFKTPTPIQAKCLPVALQQKDIIGLAQTGSGKTLAFSIPIIQSLLTTDHPKPFYAFILAPTRELAVQTHKVVQSLGEGLNVRSCCILGGMDMVSQGIMLAKNPHIVVATPGRLIEHLEKTKGFGVGNTKFLVLDEADRLLEMDFEEPINKLVKLMPRDRNTYLFSATMTTKVAKLQRASLRDPVKIEVSSKYQTVSTLLQYYVLTPLQQKDLHLVYLAHSLSGHSIIVFTRTVSDSQRLSILLRLLSFPSIPLHGQLSQSSRLESLNKFKTGQKKILVATDVASRGLDIPSVDFVINYHLPMNSKDYIHRVGRTARAGRSGQSITLVSQYDVEIFQRIESVLGQKMPEWPGVKGGAGKEEMALMRERVEEMQREAGKELRELENRGGKGGKRKRKMDWVEDGDDADKDLDDDTVEAGIPRMKKKKREMGGGKRR